MRREAGKGDFTSRGQRPWTGSARRIFKAAAQLSTFHSERYKDGLPCNVRGGPVAAGSTRPGGIYHVGLRRTFNSLAKGFAIVRGACGKRAKLRGSHDEQTLVTGQRLGRELALKDVDDEGKSEMDKALA